jgi:quinol monooxygenase YgiN
MPILRSYRVRVRPEKVREYEAFERDEGVPMVVSMPGCVRAGFGRVAEAEEPTYVFFSVWKTKDDLERARATGTWKRVAGKLETLGLTLGGDASEHWEIVALQDAKAEPPRVHAG